MSAKFITIMNKIEKQRAHYENIAQKYFERRQLSSYIVFKRLLWQFFFRDKNYLKSSVLVLEPMCGYAEGKGILEEHLNGNIEYEGFDNCDTCLDIAHRADPCVKVYKMDATKFKAGKKYDLVILIGGLHHIPDFAKDFVGTIHEILNKGGYFINFEPTHDNSFYKIIRELIYKKNPMFDSQTEKGFALSHLNGIYSSFGFKIIDQIYPGLLSYILYFNPEAFIFLNIGNKWSMRLVFNIEKIFFKNIVGRKLSFATLTLLQK